MSTENEHRQFKEGIPNPGSREAVNQGCICPVWDNEHGEGMNIGDRTLWYVTKGCPLHSPYINWGDDKPEQKDPKRIAKAKSLMKKKQALINRLKKGRSNN